MNNYPLPTSEDPIFNIGSVARITGIPVVNLHTWERRYGFPISTRTPGGHRLYSEGEIQRLQFVKKLIDQGMQTRQAIKLVQAERTTSPSINPQLSEYFQENDLIKTISTKEVPNGRFIDALIHLDIERADQILRELIAVYSPEELTLKLIGPALHEVGERWTTGSVSIADEHLISNYLRHKLLMWMNTGPRPRSTGSIVLACAPDEWHEGSLLMLGVLLSRQAWQLTYLGQNVPLADLASYVQKYAPLAVVCVAMQKESAEAFSEWSKWIHPVSERPFMMFGGKAFLDDPNLQKKVPGIYLGDDIQSGVNRLNTILHDT
jgi:DNA-binding transcriptional MerR regulator